MKPVKILYTNYRGETSVRNILPKKLYFGSTEYHKDEQWLLLADDLDKNEERTFAMKDVNSWF